MTIIERDPLLPLQRAMYSRLSEDDVIRNEGVKVFDRVTGNHYPRVVIGEDRGNPDDHECHSATDVFATVRIYTDTVGKGQVKRLIQRARFILTKPSGFKVDGFFMVWGHCTSAEIIPHENTLIHQSPIEFSYRFTPDAA